MGYSIAQVAEKTNLTPHTLRYYEKEGLLPSVERSGSGIRNFKDSDLEWIEVINCLKNTGMPIKKIREYMALCHEGDCTCSVRKEMLLKHREEVLAQMAELQKNLEKLHDKISWYDKMCPDTETGEND